MLTWFDVVVVAGAGASLAASFARTMIPLRIAACASNAMFLVYAIPAGIWPSIVLNGILLPINLYRLVDMRRLVKRVRRARGTFDAEWLRPYMNRRKMAAGKTIFSKGDPANRVFYVVSGRVLFPERGDYAGEGRMFGEIGVFTPEGRRTLSAVCDTDVELLYISTDELKELYFQNPEFGFHLVQLIVGRLKGQVDHLEQDLARERARTAALDPL
jgi:hypothetical protein